MKLSSTKRKKDPFNSEYYVEKLPLYIREGLGKQLNNYYSWLGLTNSQLEKFNIDFRENIKLIKTPKGKEFIDILSKGIYQTQFQNKLEFYYDQFKGKKENLIYYKVLAHLVETSTLRYKSQWRNIFYSYELISKTTKNALIVENETTAKLTLYLRPGVDQLIVWIFKNILPKAKWTVDNTSTSIWTQVDSDNKKIFAGFDGPEVLYENVYFDFDSVNTSIEDKYE